MRPAMNRCHGQARNRSLDPGARMTRWDRRQARSLANPSRLGPARRVHQHPPFRREEQHRPVTVRRDLDPPLMNGSMMPPTEEQRVPKARFAPVGPVFHVMRLGEPAPAPGESASPVPLLERPPDVRRDGARSAAHVHHRRVLRVDHRHHRRIARHAPRRLRGNANPVQIRASRARLRPRASPRRNGP